MEEYELPASNPSESTTKKWEGKVKKHVVEHSDAVMTAFNTLMSLEDWAQSLGFIEAGNFTHGWIAVDENVTSNDGAFRHELFNNNTAYIISHPKLEGNFYVWYARHETHLVELIASTAKEYVEKTIYYSLSKKQQ